MKKKMMGISLVVALYILCGCPAAVYATIVYDFGGEYNIDFYLHDDVKVLDSSTGEPTTVNIIAGGVIDDYMKVFDNSIINVDGGRVDWVDSFDESRIGVFAGEVESFLRTNANSHASITGGTLSGTNVFSLQVLNNSSVDISGGLIKGKIEARDDTKIYISGGLLEGVLDVYTSSIVTISGSNFNYDFGEITNTTGILTGMLTSGDLIDILFYVHDNASIVLVHDVLELYTLTVQTEPDSITTVTPSVGEHIFGGLVDINADKYISCPDVYKFDHWIGDVADPNSANTTIVMDANEIVTAVFVEDRQCGDVCHPYPLADISRDCEVNLQDLALVAIDWLACTKPECDYDNFLVGWWQFDETSGATALDSSIYENSGTLINGPVWTGSGELLFDGVDDYVEVPDSSSLVITEEITISVWVYLNDYGTDWPKVVIKPHDDYSSPWEMYCLDLSHYGTYPKFIITDGFIGGDSAIAYDNTITLNLNQWYYIVGTYDGDTIALYLNGQLIASSPSDISIGTNDMPLSIGGRLGINSFNGLIDDARIYNRPLTQGYVEQLYEEGE